MSFKLKVPNVGESITSVTVGEWLKTTGEYVNEGDIICELESEKATFDFTAEASGILKILVETGETVNIGDEIGLIELSSAKETDQKKASDTQKDHQEKNLSVEGYPSPAAQKIIHEKSIDSHAITGTGKDGRIVKSDVIFKESDKQTPSKEESSSSCFNSEKQEKRSSTKKPMSALRRTIAKRLVQVKNETAMLTTFAEVDLLAIKNLRKNYQEIYTKKYNVKLGFMSFFTKAVTTAMQDFPEVNAQIEGNEIVYYNYCDISIAVSTDKGLVTPVIRNAESLECHEIEIEIKNLANKARSYKLKIEDMQGGTFTITNGGIFGSMLSTPIINPPQSAILGMHSIVDRPVVIRGEIQIRPMMYLALSYDHRIIDGKESVGFLYRVKELLEDPTRMLLKI